MRERPQLARSEYRRGVAAMKVGDYATALAAFKYGYAVSARPGFLFNIAQCYRNLGRYREAAAVLESYRPYAPAERGAAIDALLCQLEKLARQQPAR
ncbi:MAG: tetratricopeptide repeat protein [Myxococcales bacterium]|nr:tetratricopeptide repeat protein [Myxococcales bacterium]